MNDLKHVLKLLHTIAPQFKDVKELELIPSSVLGINNGIVFINGSDTELKVFEPFTDYIGAIVNGEDNKHYVAVVASDTLIIVKQTVLPFFSVQQLLSWVVLNEKGMIDFNGNNFNSSAERADTGNPNKTDK